MRIIETKVYTIDEHPRINKCFEWIRDNWHDLNQHNVDDLITSIKELTNKIGGTNKYAISQTPDRGEFIEFEDYDKEILNSLNDEEYPLTGNYWDQLLINGLKENNLQMVLDTLHEDTEYTYSDENLYELCMANDYEFDETGKAI